MRPNRKTRINRQRNSSVELDERIEQMASAFREMTEQEQDAFLTQLSKEEAFLLASRITHQNHLAGRRLD